MLPRRGKYPQVNNLHNLRHIVHDYNKVGASDEEILKLSGEEGRILITKNIKDFKEKCADYKVDVIGVTETMPPEELDKLLLSKLRSWARLRRTGRFTKIVRAPRRSR